MKDEKVVMKKEQYVEMRKEGTQDTEKMNVLVSGVLHREGRTFVRVSFLRGKDWAEGIVPDGVIEKSEGFTEKEIGKLEEYLAREKDMFIRQAKGVNPIRKMFGI